MEKSGVSGIEEQIKTAVLSHFDLLQRDRSMPLNIPQYQTRYRSIHEDKDRR
jgi:hypothetical protein